MASLSCPRCSYPLITLPHEGVELDYCGRCSGTWLDEGEGAAVLGAAADPDLWNSAGIHTRAGEATLRCPVEGSPLDCLVLSHAGEDAEIDLCPRCKGMWLDEGEGSLLCDIVTTANQSHDSMNAANPGLWTNLVQALSGIPVEVWNPVRRFPYVMISLLVIMVVVFIVELVLGGGVNETPELLGFMETLGHTPSLTLSQPWTLITYAFLHGGLLHIAGNLYFLYVFGDNIEDTLGWKRFLVFFTVTAIAGGLAQGTVDANTVMVGASGAVAGLMGAYLVIFPKVKVFIVIALIPLKLNILWYMAIWIGLQLLLWAGGVTAVAWMAHLGGFAAGVLLALPHRRKTLAQALLSKATAVTSVGGRGA